MNSLPAADRGAGSGMNTTFQNSAQVLSIGIFFTLIIVGLSDHLPAALVGGLTAHGVPESTARSVSHLPPVSTLFAAFLGYNPASHLLGPHVLAQLTPAQRATVTGGSFFPGLIDEFLQGRPPHRLQLRHRHVPGGGGLLVDPGRQGTRRRRRRRLLHRHGRLVHSRHGVGLTDGLTDGPAARWSGHPGRVGRPTPPGGSRSARTA